MHITLYTLLFLRLITLIHPAQAYVNIDKEFSFQAIEESFKIQAGNVKIIALPSSNQETKYNINITVTNKSFKNISVWLCTKEELELLIDNHENLCSGRSKANSPVTYEYLVHNGGAPYLVIDNSHSLFTEKTFFCE